MTRNIDHRRLGRLRQGQGEIANHIIDEFAAGTAVPPRLHPPRHRRRHIGPAARVDPRGLQQQLVELVELVVERVASAAGAAGAVIKAGITTPTAAINPVTVADQGGLDMLAQTGEYLSCPTRP